MLITAPGLKSKLRQMMHLRYTPTEAKHADWSVISLIAANEHAC